MVAFNATCLKVKTAKLIHFFERYIIIYYCLDKIFLLFYNCHCIDIIKCSNNDYVALDIHYPYMVFVKMNTDSLVMITGHIKL